jgi:Ni/Fe-hydrogenase subunit HybB-like protein
VSFFAAVAFFPPVILKSTQLWCSAAVLVQDLSQQAPPSFIIALSTVQIW